MARERPRGGGEGGGSGETDGHRSTTRRGLLAFVGTAGAGLTSAGLLLGEGDGGGERRGGSGGTGDAGPVAVRRETTRATEVSGSRGRTPVIGANLNGRPHRIADRLELIDASDTRWVRAFLDVREKLAGGGRAEDDPDVIALSRLARERDCKLVVSLKWDFSARWSGEEPMAVPPPGSNAERELLDCAARYLAAVGSPVDVVVLGNEPMWETLEADIRVAEPPIVEFTRNAKDHLVEHGDHGDPTYLVGAFNRAHDDATRERHFPGFYRGMFDLVRDDPDVDGIDLHVHFDRFEEAEATAAVARAALPEATIAATEFSPVWRYHRHVHDPIDASPAGEQFAREHGLPPGTTAVEYFERAKREPITPGELADFYAAVPWYNVDHVADVYDLFEQFDVSLGTFGFLAGRGMRREDWTRGWTPFHINFLFQPAFVSTEAGLEHTANRHYLEDYRERSGWDE